ncbi:restriction endonuclease subunit S [Helicobacter pylori]
MIGPLSSQLNAIKWGEFSYETIYELQKTTKLLSKKDCVENGKIPLFTSDSKNNGIVGYVNCKPSYKLKNNQCMVVFGDHTRTFNIAKNDFCIADNVKVLKPIKDFSIRILLFINTMWGKKIIDKGYARHWSLAKTAKIQLPLKPTANTQTLDDIDFNFMEKFIAELEQCRLAELEAYLKAAGLSNTTLSNDEENALNLFNGKNSGGNTPCGLTWQSFKLGDLFEIYTGRDIIIGQTQQGDIPLVSHQHENNGITKTIKEIYNRTIFNYKQTIALADRGVFLATTQNKDFHIGTRVKALVFKNGEQDKKTRLFFTTCINKNQIMFLDYSSNATNKLPNLTISLPTNQHGKIDFHFMRTFINALMKQTIQGVVQYSSAKIQATKEIISQEAPTQKDSLF